MPAEQALADYSEQRQRPNAPVGLADIQRLRIAIVHDWLTAYAGSERVLEQILDLFPAADLFTLVDHLPSSERAFLKSRVPQTSFLQHLPCSNYLFRKLLWLLPAAAESFDLANYDLILSSSHAVAKGVLSGPHQVHLCYCHSPIRYAWDLQHEYLRQSGLETGLKSIYARSVLHYLRLWDARTSHGVDHFVANSNFVASRIRKVYRRAATVIHPPVSVETFPLRQDKEDYYLAVSRLVPYKRMDLIVAAFAKMPNRKLIVVGEGQGLAQCRALASSNTVFLSHQSAEQLQQLMSRARAFVFAAEEDFGIVVVEAQACGTPVICYGRGGAIDIVLPDRTGVFFNDQTVESIVGAVHRFESGTVALWDPVSIRAHAMSFGTAEFRRKFAARVVDLWKSHRETQEPLTLAAVAAGCEDYRQQII